MGRIPLLNHHLGYLGGLVAINCLDVSTRIYPTNYQLAGGYMFRAYVLVMNGWFQDTYSHFAPATLCFLFSGEVAEVPPIDYISGRTKVNEGECLVWID